MRFRVTVTADGVLLRGHVESVELLRYLASRLEGYALVVASPDPEEAEEDAPIPSEWVGQ